MSHIKDRLTGYHDFMKKLVDDHQMVLASDVLEMIEQIEDDLEEDEKENGWIPVNERMPEERDSIFAKWKGTERWRKAMFEKKSNEVLATVEYPDGTRVTEATYTIDGEWKMTAKVLGGIVVSWKPFPEPYKEGPDE